MIERQRGALNLVWVAIFSALVSVAAMAALWSMRYERNLFAEAVSAVAGGAPARQAIDAARGAAAAVDGGSGAMRKCVIDGKTVISNTECLDSNKTSKDIKIHDTRGFEAPRVPVAPPAAATSDPALDKIIEKQLH
jgi:type II secretory pathway pseudopilin PulG